MTVDDILAQAEELGHMIRETEIFREFIMMSEKLNGSDETRKNLEDYINLSRALQQRQDAGDIIEKFEQDELESLAQAVSEDDTAMQFLAARQKYLDLLMHIQQEISGIDDDSGPRF